MKNDREQQARENTYMRPEIRLTPPRRARRRMAGLVMPSDEEGMEMKRKNVSQTRKIKVTR